MRGARVIATLAALAAVVAGVVVLASGSRGDDRYSVDVVFDDARGLVPGQLVQVAGADVGTIEAVSVTRDFKGRIHLDVEARFGPFRENATCTIKSKGLIAENYVQCDPGTPDKPELKPRGGDTPTVPVERTTQPVNLVDLFEIWNAPTRQRAQLLLSSLGISFAGRGQDINSIVRRANPSLALARETIGILEQQRDDLAVTVDASGEVADAVAERPQDVPALLRHGARVAAQTADHRDLLGAGVRKLPPLLEQAQPALAKLDATMEAGQPLLDQLEAAAPDVNRVSTDIPQLANAARPTLRRLRPVLRDGAATAKRSKPMLALLEGYARRSLPSARTAGVMFPELEKRGFVDDLLGFFYNMAVATARYDEIGHVLPAHVGLSSCSIPADEPDPECRGEHAEETPAKRRSRRGDRGRDRDRPGREPNETPAAPAAPAPSPAAPAPSVPSLPVPAPAAPDAPPANPQIDQLLDFLLG